LIRLLALNAERAAREAAAASAPAPTASGPAEDAEHNQARRPKATCLAEADTRGCGLCDHSASDIFQAMRTTVEAIYEDGVLRPVRALDLPEHCVLRLVVETGEEAQRAQEAQPDSERAEWMALSERSLSKVWDNPEDDVYNALLAL
jgi:predicted DNA-binding antitoxin AbrB/MazE fold protein